MTLTKLQVVPWKADPKWLRWMRASMATIGLCLMKAAVDIFVLNYMYHGLDLRKLVFCGIAIPIAGYLFIAGLTGRADALQSRRDKDDALERRKIAVLSASLRKTDDE